MRLTLFQQNASGLLQTFEVSMFWMMFIYLPFQGWFTLPPTTNTLAPGAGPAVGQGQM